MKYSIPLTALALLLAGCAAPMVLMKNDKGEMVRCESDAGTTMMGGYIGSKMNRDACVRQYEAAGYQRVDGQ